MATAGEFKLQDFTFYAGIAFATLLVVLLGAWVQSVFFSPKKQGDIKKKDVTQTAKPKAANPSRIPLAELQKNPRGYTVEEIAKHNKRDDCWLIIKDKVYDVTDYVDKHQGGDAILNNAGADSTVGFFGPQHPVSVKDTVEEFYIGYVIK